MGILKKISMLHLHLDTSEFSHLTRNLSASQVMRTQQMVINRAAKKGRTEIRKAIQTRYTFPTNEIYNTDPLKGLNVELATGNNPEAKVLAGHIPRNLSANTIRFKSMTVGHRFATASNIKTRKQRTFREAIKKYYVESEIVKGQKTVFHSAFMLGVRHGKKGTDNTSSRKTIFARGKRGSTAFKFSTDFARKPIDSISGMSIATAANNTRIQQMFGDVTTDFARNEYRRMLAAKIASKGAF